ncbi:MFS transporter [Planotetraspora kaengkrachanensis]|uniref:MFS transporter n=1 Tax=Planotetraspora kaengkrachanensis TaxID=575193 RepID=A0A8J3VBP3_9ACTN|nr:MFS transporter [Planotetraspora kaengkrachanensis]GIG84133.1 MFS transporter [Planotetraspora kaengkrachanensis]
MPEPPPRTLRALARRLRLDLTPLRGSRDFRLLLGSSLITMIGSVVTMVAVPYQMKQLTGSYVAVGLVGLAEFVPMVVCGLWGGAIADALDRRRIVISSEVGLCLTSVLLLVNALLPEPQAWVLYVVGALAAGFASVRGPSEQALINRVLPLDQMTAAFAIQGLVRNTAMIAGPAAGGIVVASFGPATSYGIDVVTFLISLVLLVRVRTVARSGEATPASLRSMAEGVRYALRRPDLMGTYLVDIGAMAFAFSNALFPFLVDDLNAPKALGLLYAAGGVGSVVASLTSGWTNHVHRHGLAVILSATAWGVAVAIASVMPNVWLVFLFLAIAGGADMVSGLFRGTIWNQTIPDAYRGRLAGIELLSYSTGPMLGDARAGFMAQLGGTRFSLGAGGLLCVGVVALMATALPRFRGYDARTDEHALAERARRAGAPATA